MWRWLAMGRIIAVAFSSWCSCLGCCFVFLRTDNRWRSFLLLPALSCLRYNTVCYGTENRWRSFLLLPVLSCLCYNTVCYGTENRYRSFLLLPALSCLRYNTVCYGTENRYRSFLRVQEDYFFRRCILLVPVTWDVCPCLVALLVTLCSAGRRFAPSGTLSHALQGALPLDPASLWREA